MNEIRPFHMYLDGISIACTRLVSTMKFKSWMETHVVRTGRKKEKKKKNKKQEKMSVDLTGQQQLDSAGNSPTSPQLPSPDAVGEDSDDLPPAVAYLSPFRIGARGTCACACFSAGLTSAFPCTCYPSLQDPCAVFDEFRRLHSIRTSLTNGATSRVGSASPRPRSKIRTNPWLSINRQLSSQTSNSSSECGSVFEAEIPIKPENKPTTPSDVTSPSTSDGNWFVSTDEGSDSVSIVTPEADESSDTDDCETLNELGHFDENYEYDRETDILQDEPDDRKNIEPDPWWEETGNRTPLIEEPIQFADDDDDDEPIIGGCFENSQHEGATRTLGEIRESLEEKVQRLRLERLVVEDKIREAREEERLRREEKIKFQKQLILHRRQILLRTLQQLREKLEDQSARLQDAYSATLQMQFQVRKQLRNNAEAPF